ncbi:cytochrome c [Steroidobacter agaridevorans]|uniref:Cytochrome c n=1 Tax=Steroidobacter agaridevorans TaxID=2695856 RepID=A0A829Y4P4_9GAMM|nr:c-type cytochrome [Steroidobacter agaridevorans]GFE78147.1 cytochrome c [Steroidobacter agaridevorans]GFE91206.1 cytochrome c [Steroidobacter agaridevorans]
MKFQSMVLLTVLCGLQAGVSFAAEQPVAGSAEKGQAKAAPCVACHGVNGNSVNPEWPNLAGQHETYIKRQLSAFKSDQRQNVLMTPMAKPLSDEDIADLGAYFASQKSTGTLEAEPSKVALGQKLFRGGDPAKGIAACAACHGPDGAGNPAAGYAQIKGQHATYTINQLKAYRSGTRQTDPNQMMRNVASLLTDEQIDAVAAYIQGLR